MIRSFLINVAFFIGLAGIAYGAWLIYEPIGYIVGGIELAGIAALYVRGED